MQHQSICSECNRPCTISYDENDGTVIYCPFCGEESLEEDGELTYNDATDAWDEDEEIHL